MITRRRFAAIAAASTLAPALVGRAGHARADLRVNGQAGPRGTGPADNVGIGLGWASTSHHGGDYSCPPRRRLKWSQDFMHLIRLLSSPS